MMRLIPRLQFNMHHCIITLSYLLLIQINAQRNIPPERVFKENNRDVFVSTWSLLNEIRRNNENKLNSKNDINVVERNRKIIHNQRRSNDDSKNKRFQDSKQAARHASKGAVTNSQNNIPIKKIDNQQHNLLLKDRTETNRNNHGQSNFDSNASREQDTITRNSRLNQSAPHRNSMHVVSPNSAQTSKLHRYPISEQGLKNNMKNNQRNSGAELVTPNDKSPRKFIFKRSTVQHGDNNKEIMDSSNANNQKKPRQPLPQKGDVIMKLNKEKQVSNQHGAKLNNPEKNNNKLLNEGPNYMPRLASLYKFKRRAANKSSGWSGCNLPGPGDNLLEIGEPRSTTICIIVSQSENWVNDNKFKRWTFQPTPDEYSYFTIPKAYDSMVTNHDTYSPGYHVSIHVESQQSISYQRRYFDFTTEQVFPYLTAIIIVENGEVIGMTWDESCLFCEKDRCIDNTYDYAGSPSTTTAPNKSCYFDKKECDEDIPKCELKIYFAWSGTDKHGKVLSSSNSRYSAFPP